MPQLQRPAWVKQMKKEPKIREQITIVAGPMMAGAADRSRMTGMGQDNVFQPLKRTGDVHEGEGVLNADVMQAIGADTFNALVQKAGDGSLNLNALRQALGIQGRPGYATGGIVKPVTAPVKTTITKPVMAPTTTSVPPSQAGPSFTTPEISSPKPASTPLNSSWRVGSPTSVAPEFVPMGPINSQPITAPAVNAPKIDMPTPPHVAPVQTQTATAAAVAAPVKEPPTVPEFVPIAPVQTQTATAAAPAPAAPPAPGPATVAPTPVAPVTKPYIPAPEGLIYTPKNAQEAQEFYENKLLTDRGLAQAAGTSALEQTIAQKGMGTGVGNTIRAENRRTNEEGMGEAISTLANQNVANMERFQNLDEAKYDALNQKINDNVPFESVKGEIMEINPGMNESDALGYYNNIKSGKATYSSIRQKIADNVPFDAVKKDIMDLNPGMDESAALKYYNDVKIGKMTVDPGRRIDTMIDGGRSLGYITGDQVLRNDIASKLGVDPADSKVTDEITTIWRATLNNKRADAIQELERLIDDAVDNRQKFDVTKADPRVRTAAAISLGLDPASPDNASRIDDEITRRWNFATMPDVDRVFNNFVDNDRVPASFKDYTGWQGDLKIMIRDILNNPGVTVDKSGNIDLPDNVAMDWPWSNPSTYTNYTNWNGENIVYDANGAKPAGYAQTVLKYEGNGTTYKNAAGQAVTFGDLDTRWNGLGPDQQEEHFVNGKPDVEWLLSPFKASSVDKDGNVVVVTSPEQITEAFLQDPKKLTSITTEIDKWQSPAVFPETYMNSYGEVITGDANAQYGRPVGDQFVFTDQYGMLHVESTSSPLFATIWQQLSNKYNGGTPLAADAGSGKTPFNQYWKNGQGWIVDPKIGGITNIDGAPVNSDSMAGYVDKNLGIDAWKPGALLDATAVSKIMSTPDIISSDKIISGDHILESMATNHWDENRWKLTSDTIKWVNENMYKLYRASNGRLYAVAGVQRPRGNNCTEYIILRDVVTNQKVAFNNAAGDSASRQFVAIK